MNNWNPWPLKKIKTLVAILKLSAKRHCQFSLFTKKMGQMGWIGSAVWLVAPKRPPGFWFCQWPWVSIIHLSLFPQFNANNKLFQGSVILLPLQVSINQCLNQETKWKNKKEPTCIIVHSTVVTIMRLFLFNLTSTSIQCQTIIINFHITQWVNNIKKRFLNFSFTGRFLLEKLFWFDWRIPSSFNGNRKSLNIVSTIVAGTGTTRIGGTSATFIVLFRIKRSEN